ncbi:MAG: hypothetical protein R6X32_09190 [Chloroflexota bacterium]
MTWPNLPAWLLLNATALLFALAHSLVDFHLGLFGQTSIFMTPLQAANILFICLITGWWSVSLAIAAGDGRGGLSSAFVLSLVWAFLGHGAVAVVAAPPPSAAFPYQDITHFGSLIFGGLAVYATRKEMKARAMPFNRSFVVITVVLIVAAMAINGVLALSNMASLPPAN